MIPTAQSIEDLTLNVTQEIHVRAPLDVTFAALLEQLGPHNEVTEGTPMPMKIEPWPGGRWYRDLGDGNGHFWGHVQAIKRPTLLEISGLVHVLSGRLECAVPLDGGRRWNADQVPSHGAWIDRGGSQKRSVVRLEPHPRARPQAGRGLSFAASGIAVREEHQQSTYSKPGANPC